MLHQVLRFEVRARAILDAAGVDDGEVAFFPRGFERAKIRMQAEAIVEAHGVGLPNAEARAGAVVVVVLDGRHEREAIRAAAQKDDDERAALVAVAGEDGLRRVH